MRKALISVHSQNSIPLAALSAQLAQKYLPDWDRVDIMLDMDAGQITENKVLPYINAQFLPAAQFFSPNFSELAFFFNQRELTEFTKIAVAKDKLPDYSMVLLIDPDVLINAEFFQLETSLSRENSSVRVVNQKQLKNGKLPEYFLLEHDPNYNNSAFAISHGPVSMKFLSWCERKFYYLFENDFLTYSLEREVEKQASFIWNWDMYVSVFGLNSSIVKFPYDQYVANKYRFNSFSDGIQIHPFMREYYMHNQRVRDECEADPFHSRQIFTDQSTLAGDEHVLPLTIIEEYLWLSRPDIQSAYPDYHGKDRSAFTEWVLEYGKNEFDLPNAYVSHIEKMRREYESRLHQLQTADRSFMARVKRTAYRVMGRPLPVVPVTNPLPEKYPGGVNLCGFIRGDFGLSEATRILARTFDAGQLPFTIVNYQPARVDHYTSHEWDQKITNRFEYNTNVILMNSNWMPYFFQTISSDALKGRYNIGFWYWELPEYPDKWVKFYDYFDEIWTASEFSVKAFQAKTSKPVRCVPCCVTVPYNEQYDRKYFHLPEDKFLFMMMYDVRSVQKRKNPMAVIRAFVEAFGDRTDVGLVIKVSTPNGWQLEEELQYYVDKHQNIILVNGTFTKEKVNSLINCCDAFVSLHRSEGFGLGPAEAMYLGKPAVLTNWSGNMQYMRPDNCCPVDYRIVELEEDIGPYEKGSHWADPDVHQAAQYMKRLADDSDYYHRIAENGKRTIREEFSPKAVCQFAEKRLKELNLLS